MKHLFFLLTLLFCLPLAAQQTYRARVVDAETGEALPYASIYISKDNGTLTNMEGEFAIKADEKEMLTVTYIGYKQLKIHAKDVKEVIRLESLAKTLQEVTIIPAEDILRKVAEGIGKEYRYAASKKGTYYYRLSNRYADKMEFVEAYLTSHNAVNLRDICFDAGRRALEGSYAQSQSRISYSNLQHLLEVGAFIRDSPYWDEKMPTPLELLIFRNEPHYNYSCRPSINYFFSAQKYEVEGTPGIYKINTRIKQRRYKPYLVGTLYIDAENYRLLAFEGTIQNLALDLMKDFHNVSDDVKPQIRVTYTHRRKYTEVESLVVTLEAGDLKSNSLLFNMGNRKLPFKKGKRATDNMVEVIDEAQYDSTMWQEVIVQRLKEEERLLQDGKLHEADTLQWQYANRDITYASSPFQTSMERLSAFGKTIPQEKIYIHMDNTCYFQGDTIWFAAYTRKTSTDTPSNVSGVLYVELLNNDGYLVERKLIEMREGRGNGFFALNNQIQYSGFYELRAYTRWQLNWGLFEHPHSRIASRWFASKDLEQEFYRDYEKLYSRVFPVYDRPLSPGNYERDMTLRVLRRTFKNNPDTPQPTLTLYPEGGNLVAGVPNRVAFEAVMSDGKWLEGSLKASPLTLDSVASIPRRYATPNAPLLTGICPNANARLALLRGEENQEEVQVGGFDRGRGVFTIVPEKGMEQEVTFTTKNGQAVKARLPKPEERGVALQVRQEGDSTHIVLHLAGVSSDSLGLTIMHEGRVESFYALSNYADTAGIKPLPIGEAAKRAGVHQVTVFDTSGHVWADRLFFVTRQEEMQPTLSVSGAKEEYQPYDSIGLDIQGKAGEATLSLTVRDGYQADALYDNANIMVEMLLSSEIRGFVPDPGWFFEADDSVHRAALDLLMMTQGWRRFNWRDMAVRGTWDLTQPDEKTPTIQGSVRNHAQIYSAERIEMELERAKERYLEMDEDDNMAENVKQTNKKVHDNDLNQENEKEQMFKKERARQRGWAKPLDIEVRVHAELLPSADGDILTREVETKNGHFRFHLPPYYGRRIFFLDASDTTKWKKRRNYPWVRTSNPPTEFNVKIDFPFPRFVKPYNFYQNHLKEVRNVYSGPAFILADSVHILKEVSVTQKHGRLRGFDQSQPAVIMDAYDAMILVDDSGIHDEQCASFAVNLVRALFGDYGLEYPYRGKVNEENNEVPENIYEVYGPGATRRGLPQYIDLPVDSLYSHKYLRTLGRGFNFSQDEMNDYTIDKRHKIAIYTDYCPRLEGSKAYSGSNLPETRVAIYPFYDGSRRTIYTNRRYILDGFAAPAEFYSPNYSKQTPPKVPTDYRRTLYWNPNLKLDAEGRARVTLYNNSRTTQIEVEAAGQAADGTLLWNK